MISAQKSIFIAAVLACATLACISFSFAGFITTNDNISIYFEEKGKGKPLLIIHGWSCNGRFFKHNFDELAKNCHVIRMDLRGHGQSDKAKCGYRISRFAKDVKDLIEALNLEHVTLLGWSMGGAICWGYYQLFLDEHLRKMIIVDQSPAQHCTPEWEWGQPGCYHCETLTMLCDTLKYDPRSSAKEVTAAYLTRSPSPEEEEFFVSEMMKCPGWVRCATMRDHINHDWRDLLPQIQIPTLVLVGRKSKVFQWEGSALVGRLIPGAKTVFFEKSGHMPFYEESRKFNRVVTEFVNQ